MKKQLVNVWKEKVTIFKYCLFLLFSIKTCKIFFLFMSRKRAFLWSFIFPNKFERTFDLKERISTSKNSSIRSALPSKQKKSSTKKIFKKNSKKKKSSSKEITWHITWMCFECLQIGRTEGLATQNFAKELWYHLF